MDLKQFIQQTIEGIVDGVTAAQESIRSKGAEINPKSVQFQDNGQWNRHNSGMPRQVEFDVGLTSTSRSGSSEGIGVFLGSVNLGKKNDGGTEHTAATRIRFTVPLVLPTGTANDGKT